MRKQHRSKTADQLDLFVQPPERPTWNRLPATVTQKVTELLGELLRRSQTRWARSGKEAPDE